MTIVIFAAGMAALVLGANVLVRGASKLALSLGISPLVVGLTVVAFGTSAPEMAVSVGAVLSGRTAWYASIMACARTGSCRPSACMMHQSFRHTARSNSQVSMPAK